MPGGFGLSQVSMELRRANVLSLSRHVPSLSGSATRRVAQNEARKRRANERHVVGCCEELCRGRYERQLANRFSELNIHAFLMAAHNAATDNSIASGVSLR